MDNETLDSSASEAEKVAAATSSNQALAGDPSVPEQNAIIQKIFKDFNVLHDETLLPLHDNACFYLAIIGLVGGILGLGTMLHNRYMQVTSYIYHKLVVIVTIVYCTNWLTVYILDNHVSIIPNRVMFESHFAAYYDKILQRVVSSSTGYVWQYASLITSLDRFIALSSPKAYKTFSSSKCCFITVFAILFLSFSLHSWAPWFEQKIIMVNSTDFGVYYTSKSNIGAIPQQLLKVKDILNLIIRGAYPILMTFFTIMAIVFYLRRGKANRAQRSARFRRQQRSLFLLMIGVVILAYLQVIPRETKRILDLLYPSGKVLSSVNNFSIPFQTRLHDFKMWNNGIRTMKLVTNFCTVLDRALPFYLYFLLNPLFRRACLQFLCGGCLRLSRRLEPLLVSGGDDEEERKELLLLFSPQLVGNMKSVFTMTEMLCRGFMAMNYQKQALEHSKLLEQRSNEGPAAFHNNGHDADFGNRLAKRSDRHKSLAVTTTEHDAIVHRLTTDRSLQNKRSTEAFL